VGRFVKVSENFNELMKMLERDHFSQCFRIIRLCEVIGLNFYFFSSGFNDLNFSKKISYPE
jgi:hypothetical protein